MRTQTRVVLVLGRRPSVAWDRLRGGALRRGDELVVVSLGFPVTAAQRTAFLQAQTLAAEVGAWFDALLVTSPRETAGALEPDDEVIVAARGREGRRLRAALGSVVAGLS